MSVHFLKLINPDTNHCMTEAASTSKKRQVHISHLVATGLKGKLTQPSGNLFLPIPVVWVAAVTNCG